MEVFIDADGCPDIECTVALCRKYRIPCRILCDTAHEIHREGAQTLVFDKGADSVDFALVNRIQKGDLTITQDYGLASMCLARGSRVLHQDGWEYSQWNIEALLFQRHASMKFRQSGGRTKGLPKRTQLQDNAFHQALEGILRGNMSTEQPQEAHV